MRPAMMTVEQLTQALHTEFPQLFKRDGGLQIEAVWHGGGRVRRIYDNSSLRPGGTISGATMMELADFAMYVALLGSIGWLPLAVTTNLNINFLRKPAQRDLLAEVRLIKLGKRLAIGDIGIKSEGEEELVAHATATYSIPRKD
jgi:uncharacterized protein (TIGR00369 family)